MSTFVMVHGGWHTGESWDRVEPLLSGYGHRVETPTLTGFGDTLDLVGPEVGLRTHIDDVVRLIREKDLADVILVGHSYAGMVVSGVAHEVPDRIAHLVFLDAMVPEDGENAVDTTPDLQRLVDAALTSDSGWRVPPPVEQPAPRGLFGITDPEDIAWIRSTLSDLPVRCLQEHVKLSHPIAAEIPRTHIHCTANLAERSERRPVPAIQPNGSPSQVRELPTGHDAMVTMPSELAELLLTVEADS